MRPALLAWQLEHYPQVHADRTNLALHAVSVPLFVLGLLLAVAAVFRGAYALAGAGGLLAALALAAQARGHRRERNPPAPFRSPGDLLARLLAEQLVTFPRFVASGGFARAWRAAGRPPAP